MDAKLDIRETETIINKLLMYQKEETGELTDIVNSLGNITKYYNNKYCSQIESLNNQLANNFAAIDKMHYSSIEVLRSTINKYDEIVEANAKTLGADII